MAERVNLLFAPRGECDRLANDPPIVEELLSRAMTEQIGNPKRVHIVYGTCDTLEASINYQQITRRIEITKLRERSSDLVLPGPSCRAVKPSPKTRYSRSVLINRLFMFNAAWYSDTRKFSKLSDGERATATGIGGGWARKLRTRECFCIVEATSVKPVEKKVKRNCGIEFPYRTGLLPSLCLEDDLSDDTRDPFARVWKHRVEVQFVTLVRSISSFVYSRLGKFVYIARVSTELAKLNIYDGQ